MVKRKDYTFRNKKIKKKKEHKRILRNLNDELRKLNLKVVELMRIGPDRKKEQHLLS